MSAILDNLGLFPYLALTCFVCFLSFHFGQVTKEEPTESEMFERLVRARWERRIREDAAKSLDRDINERVEARL